MKSDCNVPIVSQTGPSVKNNSYAPAQAFVTHPGTMSIDPNGRLMLETQRAAMEYNSSPPSKPPIRNSWDD